MQMKDTIYNMRKMGLSFAKIAKQIGLSKTTVHRLYKEHTLELQINKGRGKSTTPERPIANAFNAFVNNTLKFEPLINDKLPKNQSIDNLKVISGNDLIVKQFKSLEFTGKFQNLIGKPSKVFAAIIWGLPKSGKSNLAIRFADYLCEYFGTVLYIAAEEGHSQSLREKFLAINGSHVKILECRDKEQIRLYLQKNAFNFVFIDSINAAGIDDDFLEYLKKENPQSSFIGVAQATKVGNFKGSQALTHNCDFIIKVENGVAYHKGRFGPTSEEKIFEGDWHTKNPNKVDTTATFNATPSHENIGANEDENEVQISHLNTPTTLHDLQKAWSKPRPFQLFDHYSLIPMPKEIKAGHLPITGKINKILLPDWNMPETKGVVIIIGIGIGLYALDCLLKQVKKD
jgi:DNA-dependent RNA polymerase auxiliary subunit epsilon